MNATWERNVSYQLRHNLAFSSSNLEPKLLVFLLLVLFNSLIDSGLELKSSLKELQTVTLW